MLFAVRCATSHNCDKYDMRNFIMAIENVTPTYPAVASTEYVIQFVFDLNGHDGDDPGTGPLPHRISRFVRYHLKSIPLSAIEIYPHDPSLAAEYAAMGAASAPPIVFDAVDNEIVDGNHRAKAAMLRGDEFVLAYVGEPADLNPFWDDEYEEE